MRDLLAARPLRHLEIEQVEDVLASRHTCPRQAAGDNLGKTGKVGPHAERHLRPTPCRAEPGHHLIQDQQRTVLFCDAAQFLAELGTQRHLAER